MHFYNYTCNSWNVSCFPTPRFASEYGLQSWCSLEAISEVSVPEEDWEIFGNFSKHREHRTDGILNIVTVQ